MKSLCLAVEFPAVLLSVDSSEIVAEFHHFVIPMENPVLSDFCRELTGISQVNQIQSLFRLQWNRMFTIFHRLKSRPGCRSRFASPSSVSGCASWSRNFKSVFTTQSALNRAAQAANSVLLSRGQVCSCEVSGHCLNVYSKQCCPVDWDISVCLRYECRRKQLQVPHQLNSWIDLRATYRVRSPH